MAGALEFSTTHRGPWEGVVAQVARQAEAAGRSESRLMAATETARRTGKLDLDAFWDARMAIVRGFGPRRGTV
jgi:hypothetical protein